VVQGVGRFDAEYTAADHQRPACPPQLHVLAQRLGVFGRAQHEGVVE
jgi:hypothetical protein